MKSKRDNFKAKTKEVLGKRAGFQCSICKSITVGPSMESITSTNNIGVAAHITAAAPGGARYDSSLKSEERSNISNGIWLCQNHAALIDRDIINWTVEKLLDTKNIHEKNIRDKLGIPPQESQHINDKKFKNLIIPKEYGFLPIRSMIPSYRELVNPILIDKTLNEESVLGLLMCGSPIEESGGIDYETPWTAFVNDVWLKWVISGQNLNYPINQTIPTDQIYGRIPAWPKDHIEFLQAIVETNTSFVWERHPEGYLILSQEKK